MGETAPLVGTRMRVAVATVFLAVWLTACIVDWFGYPGEPRLPFWFQALGIVIIGYLLGIDLVGLSRRWRHE